MAHAKYFQEWLEEMQRPRPVLLVEDNPDDCKVIVAMSKNFNIEWHVCHSYDEAIGRLSSSPMEFKLVVLDINLQSNKTGIDVFRDIKIHWPQVPVLVLSGYLTSDSIDQLTQIGFVMLAKKPLSYDRSFFGQLFQTLNIPKKPAAEEETDIVTKKTTEV